MSGPYSDTVMQHFFNPSAAYRMADPDRTGRAGAPGRGNFMVLYLKLADEPGGQRIAQASYQTYGCAPAIAAGSVLCEVLEWMLVSDARAWDEARLVQELGGLPKHKRHCAKLAVDALRSALA